MQWLIKRKRLPCNQAATQQQCERRIIAIICLPDVFGECLLAIPHRQARLHLKRLEVAL